MATPEQQLTQLTHAYEQLQRQVQALSSRSEVASAPSIARVPKPDTFSGKGNVHTWLWSLEQYFATTRIPPIDQAQFAVNLVRGHAATWVRSVVRNQPLPSWSHLSDQLRLQFSPISEEQQARDRLARLVQTKTVGSYASEFLRLSTLLPILPVADQIDRFTRGLKFATRKEVVLKDPKSLEEAIRIAERYDTLSFQFRSSTRSHAPTSIQSAPANTAVPMDIGAIRYTKLTPNERKHLLDNNGCLYCRKPNAGHFARDCPTKKQSN